MPTIVLILATLTSGLVAGVYAFYAHTVMPGLGRAGDRTFVAGFQALDRAIVNPWFMVSAFLGAPVLAAVAALLHLSEAALGVLLWVVVSLVLDLVTVGIMVGINVPANNRLKGGRGCGRDRRCGGAGGVRRGSADPVESGARCAQHGGVRRPVVGLGAGGTPGVR